MSPLILTGDARTYTQHITRESVQTCITSVPYFLQRDYDSGPGEIGKDQTIDEYIDSLVQVFRGVRDVLHKTGTLWINIGDKFTGPGGARTCGRAERNWRRAGERRKGSCRIDGLASKNLIGVPSRLALALQADGWIWRQYCIWYKGGGFPESANDRPNTRHEAFLFFSKSQQYYWNKRHVKNHGTHGWDSVWIVRPGSYDGAHTATYPPELVEPLIIGGTPSVGVCEQCHAPLVEHRTVVGRQVTDKVRAMGSDARGQYNGKGRKDYEDASAPNPSDVKRRILDSASRIYEYHWKRSCSCSGLVKPATVLDPFAGAGMTGIAALKHNREFIGIELGPQHADEARQNLKKFSEGKRRKA
ncbi:DNA-methyltransferase [Leptonema illini]|nr:site-specific DNA-methyltransferase [Leptonema illini]